MEQLMCSIRKENKMEIPFETDKTPKSIKVHTNRVDYFFNLTPKKFAKGLVQMSPKTAKKLIKALKKELK